MESDSDTPQRFYRPVKSLPFELRQHCGIFFEEKLYTQALSLLLNILISGTVASSPAYVPSPQHLAIAATLIVHPSTTTRARTTEEREAANLSLQLLRLTNTLIGSKSAKFDVAFAFTHFSSSRHGGRRRADDGAMSKEINHDDTEPLNLDLGQAGSLWSRGEDLWHVVGWAFNCSVLYPKRWERWQLWLQFMCEALEDDWDERQRQLGDLEDGPQPATPSRRRDMIRKESLIFKYLTTATAGYGRNRRILRAIFADGSPGSLNEFREVFKNEKKELKEDDDKLKKREVDVDIDQDQYGDYLAKDEGDTSDETDESRARRKRPKRGSKNLNMSPNTEVGEARNLVDTIYANGGVTSFGGLQSLELRKRLLYLLSGVSTELSKAFIPLDDLYHLFVENIRHLPLPVFQAFVAPSALPAFSPNAQTTLCEFLLFRMLESAAPDTDEEYLNQEKLEKCFLPYAANTSSVVDNAKVSILLEALLCLLAECDMLRISPALQKAVKDGIMARLQKAQDETRRSMNSRLVEDIEWCWLIESGERLMFLVEDVLPAKEEGRVVG
ncbi:hypothetical protein V8E54_003833 [Elaphomyces granulatus]